MISLTSVATNPLSNNYLTFFAHLNSACKIADEIIVASGGTSDGSFSSDLLLPEVKEKLIIVENSNTLWDYNNNFSSNQINNMTNEALKIANGDWAIISYSDYLFNYNEYDMLHKELDENKDQFWVRYSRSMNYFGNIIHDNKITSIINLNKVDKEIGHRCLYGLDDIYNIIHDYPIKAEYGYIEKTKDKLALTNICIGSPLEGGLKTIRSISVNVYQHYFYTFDQLINQKYNFYKNFWSRQRGEYIKSKKEIADTFGVAKGIYNNDFHHLSKTDVLELDGMHKEMIPLIKKYYSEDMLGGSFQRTIRYVELYNRIRNIYYKVNKKIQYKYLKEKGLRGVIDYSDIRNINEIDKSIPIDLGEIWQEQDKIYSS